MPIYEYQCTVCGERLEKLQKLSDAPLVDCPYCKTSNVLEKQVSAAGFRLKGTGWYETDFKNSGSKVPEKKTEAAKTEVAKKAE